MDYTILLGYLLSQSAFQEAKPRSLLQAQRRSGTALLYCTAVHEISSYR